MAYVKIFNKDSYEERTVYYKDKECRIKHREDGPAVEFVDGEKWWFIDDLRHREDGPAIEYENGDKEYYKNGYLHREDGPAIDYVDGMKYFFLHNKEYSEEKYWGKIRFGDFI